MWTERPRPYTDGLFTALCISGLIVAAIAILWGKGHEKPSVESQCQEVVANVAKRGYVLAQCPPGTWVDIVNDKYVICRCGRLDPTFSSGPDADVSPTPDTEEEPEPTPQRDQGVFL